MSLFVRVEQEMDAGVPRTQRLFEGELAAREAAPVTDFVLSDVARQRKFAEIADYSQWTEPPMVLLLRLLSVSKPIPELSGIAAGRVTVSLREAAVAWGAREVLNFDVHHGWLEVALICLEALDFARAAGAATPGLSVQDAVRQALAAVLGHRIHSLPPPLSSVPIRRTREGREFVWLRDVPPLPRHYLKRWLSLPHRRRIVAGAEWRAFMQQLARTSGLPWVSQLTWPLTGAGQPRGESPDAEGKRGAA